MNEAVLIGPVASCPLTRVLFAIIADVSPLPDTRVQLNAETFPFKNMLLMITLLLDRGLLVCSSAKLNRGAGFPKRLFDKEVVYTKLSRNITLEASEM